MEERKTLKEYCREAKKRLKQGFWKTYHEDLRAELDRAEEVGVNASKIKSYYNEKFNNSVKNVNVSEEEFYTKVKSILDAEGEVSDAIGRLTDKEYFNTLTYDEKQRYILNLSERYVRAVERYRKEKEMELSV